MLKSPSDVPDRARHPGPGRRGHRAGLALGSRCWRWSSCSPCTPSSPPACRPRGRSAVPRPGPVIGHLLLGLVDLAAGVDRAGLAGADRAGAGAGRGHVGGHRRPASRSPPPSRPASMPGRGRCSSWGARSGSRSAWCCAPVLTWAQSPWRCCSVCSTSSTGPGRSSRASSCAGPARPCTTPCGKRPRPEPGHARSLRGGLGAGPPAARLAGQGLADQCPAAARAGPGVTTWPPGRPAIPPAGRSARARRRLPPGR